MIDLTSVLVNLTCISATFLFSTGDGARLRRCVMRCVAGVPGSCPLKLLPLLRVLPIYLTWDPLGWGFQGGEVNSAMQSVRDSLVFCLPTVSAPPCRMWDVS